MNTGQIQSPGPAAVPPASAGGAKAAAGRLRDWLGRVARPWPLGCHLAGPSLRLAQVVRRDGRLGLVLAHSVSGPDASRSAADAIRAALRSGGLRGRRCVAAVPDASVWTRMIDVAPMPEEELPAVRWQVAKETGQKVDSFVCSAAGISELAVGDKKRWAVLVVGAGMAELTGQVQSLEAGGLEPVALDTAITAAARALGLVVEVGVNVALVHLSHDASSISVVRDGAVRCAASLSEPPELLGAAAAADADAAPAAALEGLDIGHTRALRQLAQQTSMSLQHFAQRWRLERPELLAITCERPVPPTLAAELAHQLDMALLEPSLPLPVLAGPGDGAARPPASDWLVAVGLALYELPPAAGRRAA